MLAVNVTGCKNRSMEGNGKRRSRKILLPVVPSGPGRKRGIEVQHSILGFSRVWFTWYAIQRMRQRGVSQSQVFWVLENPDKKGLKTQPDRERWRRDRIEVVFAKWPDKLCIITVMVI